MMKSMIVILLLFVSSLSSAAETLKCSKKETAIIFINGANAAADKKDVPKNVEAIEKLTQANATSLSSFSSSTRIINDSVYNNSKGLALDLVESFAQSLMIRSNLSRDSAWKAAYSFFSGFAPSPPEASITPNEQEFLDFQQLEELKNLEIADTNLLKEKIYNEYLSNDYKTVIFSHSQGNLFIDVAHKELLDQIGFSDKQGILGNLKVAAPVHLNFAIPNNQYVINNLDIFLADLTSERKTIDIVGDPIDAAAFRMQDFVAHHSLIGTYLNFANLKNEVTQRLIDVAVDLESNCGIPPVADFKFLSNAYEQFPIIPDPMTYNFDGSISQDGDIDPLDPSDAQIPNFDIDINKFEWTIHDIDKDGNEVITHPTGMNISYSFKSEGVHDAELIVTDLAGNKSEPKIIPINVVNLAPIPSFTATVDGFKVTFNAVNSSDDGRIVSYAWNFGDGEGSGLVANHTYLFPGIYPVTLTVTDNNGKSSVTMQMVEIKNQPPVANFTFDQQALVVNFDGTSSKDPDGEIVNYKWVFGDDSFGSGETSSHTYVNPGNYTVTLTVTDSGGLTNSFSQIVPVSNCVAKTIGCGGVEGSRHINSDFSCGGFVANTASVSSSWQVEENAEICGNSNLGGTGSVLGNSKITSSQISFTGTITNSVINQATIIGIGSIYNSKVNANLSASGFNDMFLFGNMDIYESTIDAPIIANNWMIIEFSTVTAPLSGNIIIVAFNNIQVM